MKAAVIQFPASNCDRDMQVALQDITGNPVPMVWHGDSELPDVDLVVLPGGFSYGDYLRCGAVAARSPIMKEVVRRAGQGLPVMGVCNGFQVLCETGLLPGALLSNAGLKFVCRNVNIRVENSQTPFTNGYEMGDVLEIPVAHHDGQYFIGEDDRQALEDNVQVAFRYVEGDDGGQANPNGSVNDIAGVFNKEKTVLGMMPHPERAIDARHGGEDGRALFQGLVSALT